MPLQMLLNLIYVYTVDKTLPVEMLKMEMEASMF
jgi:hypothetical protein